MTIGNDNRPGFSVAMFWFKPCRRGVQFLCRHGGPIPSVSGTPRQHGGNHGGRDRAAGGGHGAEEAADRHGDAGSSPGGDSDVLGHCRRPGPAGTPQG